MATLGHGQDWFPQLKPARCTDSYGKLGLELAGDRVQARASYLHAAQLTLSIPERRYLEARAMGTSPNRGREAAR